MKFSQTLVLLGLLCASCLTSAAVIARVEASGDRTVTQVVKLLQSLVQKSREEGDTERNLYSKYKCYCDTNEEQKNAEIESLTEQISILEAKVEELLASSAKLSQEVAQLDSDKTANALAQSKAQGIRDTEHTTFLALDSDLSDAISKMGQAIQALSEIGADQSMGSATDHTTYMAGQTGLATLKSTVQKALLVASSFATEKQRKSAEAFLQTPFTGVYNAQSGEVVGILRDMRSTFSANLASARQAEATALIAHNKYMTAMQEAWTTMDELYTTKQGLLSGNDGDLSSKRGQLGDTKIQLDDAKSFLASLLDMCSTKKKQYDERVALRAQEQAALSEAISILHSDEAFATFGTVQSTSSTDTVEVPPSLFQIRQHSPSSLTAATDAVSRQKAQAFLQGAAKKVGGQGSPLLSRIVSLLQANNPFAVVLQEIDKMIALLEQEGKADADQKEWCVKERGATTTDIGTAEGSISSLTGLIQGLKSEIHDPETGLLVQIEETEVSLKENYDNQVSETADRRQANVDYQKNVANLVEAQALLTKAVQVLKEYYAKLKGQMEELQVGQQSKEDPAPPETWEDNFTGQKHTGGTDAVGMLEFILGNTKKEETDAHNAELQDQHLYEDGMDGLKTSETQLQGTLAGLKATIAEKQEELFAKEKDLKKTEEELAALEAYLLKIKPGCDFIVNNIVLRDGNRATEKGALEQARDHLKGTPVYKEHLEIAHNESLGDCLGVCAVSEDHVNCKACLDHITVPGYCAGHPATSGCSGGV